MRYVSRPRGNWLDDDDPMLPDISVDGAKRTDTGLVDRLGNRIMRLQQPIGFGKR